MLSQLPKNLAFSSASPTGVATRQLSTVLVVYVDTIAAFLLVVAIDITCAVESVKEKVVEFAVYRAFVDTETEACPTYEGVLSR